MDTLNIFPVLEENKITLIIIILMAAILLSSIIGFSTPQKTHIFQGTITRIETTQVSVYVRNNQTVQTLNATSGICFDESKHTCTIGDQVEITNYQNWFSDTWQISALLITRGYHA